MSQYKDKDKYVFDQGQDILSKVPLLKTVRYIKLAIISLCIGAVDKGCECEPMKPGGL
jgi:hypothetical protein